MATPKISTPTFDVTLPSTGKKIKMRMMKGKEEKILLYAKESGEDSDILEAIKQVINNCLIDNKTNDVEKMPIFDIEYLFIRQRAHSIDNYITLELIDPEDNKEYPVRIDLFEVEVKNLPTDNKANIIKISDNVSLTMKYPSGKIYSDKLFQNKKVIEQLDILIADCLDKLYQGEAVFDFKNSSHEEKLEFLDELDVQSLEKMKNYIENLPSIEHEVSYTNSLGTKQTFIFRTLSDFFTLH